MAFERHRIDNASHESSMCPQNCMQSQLTFHMHLVVCQDAILRNRTLCHLPTQCTRLAQMGASFSASANAVLLLRFAGKVFRPVNSHFHVFDLPTGFCCSFHCVPAVARCTVGPALVRSGERNGAFIMTSICKHEAICETGHVKSAWH